MVYAIEMFFDNESEKKITSYFYKFKELGISTYLLDVDSRPHVTIGVFNDIDVKKSTDVLEKYCTILQKFTLKMSSVGVFPYPKPCVFFAPVITEKLIDLHKDMHKTFDFCNVKGFEYYLPDVWVPHCAVDISTDINVVCKSTDYILRNYIPFDVIVKEIGWIEISKPVKRLECFELR